MLSVAAWRSVAPAWIDVGALRGVLACVARVADAVTVAVLLVGIGNFQAVVVAVLDSVTVAIGVAKVPDAVAVMIVLVWVPFVQTVVRYVRNAVPVDVARSAGREPAMGRYARLQEQRAVGRVIKVESTKPLELVSEASKVVPAVTPALWARTVAWAPLGDGAPDFVDLRIVTRPRAVVLAAQALIAEWASSRVDPQFPLVVVKLNHPVTVGVDNRRW